MSLSSSSYPDTEHKSYYMTCLGKKEFYGFKGLKSASLVLFMRKETKNKNNTEFALLIP